MRGRRYTVLGQSLLRRIRSSAMAMSSQSPGENSGSGDVDALPLDAFAAVDTYDGELIVYDRENEDVWIQSDLYYPRNQIV